MFSFRIQVEVSKTVLLCKVKQNSTRGITKLTRYTTVIEDAEHQGLLHPHTGSRIFEGTVGSTGISLATVARAK